MTSRNDQMFDDCKPRALRPPPNSEFTHLKPLDSMGFFFVAMSAGLTMLSISLSTSDLPMIWALGQILLAIALLQWFTLLHEAGHNSLFRTSRLNKLVGHVAAFFAVIPFDSWKLVHRRHHYWTGWQDLDATTATLVPRKLSRVESLLINVCWKCWIPLFSTIYRINNYWNLPRLYRLFQGKRQRQKLTSGVLVLLAAYGVTAYSLGLGELVRVAGLGLFLSLVMQDPLILSQHTHVPLKLSRGNRVQPFRPVEQEAFTRSLKFPSWFSALILLNIDAHELHHMYTGVPGYYLRRIDYVPHHTVNWWRWIVKAKRVPGVVLLFQNRSQSGYDI